MVVEQAQEVLNVTVCKRWQRNRILEADITRIERKRFHPEGREECQEWNANAWGTISKICNGTSTTNSPRDLRYNTLWGWTDDTEDVSTLIHDDDINNHPAGLHNLLRVHHSVPTRNGDTTRIKRNHVNYLEYYLSVAQAPSTWYVVQWTQAKNSKGIIILKIDVPPRIFLGHSTSSDSCMRLRR